MNLKDGGTLHINQGERDALCVAIVNDRALVRYWMPNGRDYLLDVPADLPLRRGADWSVDTWKLVRNVSAKKPPARWRPYLEAQQA